MILHPGILALLLGAAISSAMMLYATGLAFSILRKWDIRSSSEGQLLLERKTYLVSSLLNLLMGFAIISGLLFFYTTDDIHPLFVGAMCATGTLNAYPTGWWLVIIKVVLFFAAGIWVILNNVDQHCEEAPLIKIKYGALPLLLFLVCADFILQYLFFSGLEPQQITSCCGSLFSGEADSVATELAALPPGPMLWFFIVTSVVFLATIGLTLVKTAPWLRLALLGESSVLLPISLASVISFIAPYVYQMPTHHCPFDMIQGNYHYIGYPLYIGLFAGLLFALMPGVLQLVMPEGMGERLAGRYERRWLLSGAAFYGVFFLLSLGYVVFSDLQLLLR